MVCKYLCSCQKSGDFTRIVTELRIVKFATGDFASFSPFPSLLSFPHSMELGIGTDHPRESFLLFLSHSHSHPTHTHNITSFTYLITINQSKVKRQTSNIRIRHSIVFLRLVKVSSGLSLSIPHPHSQKLTTTQNKCTNNQFPLFSI